MVAELRELHNKFKALDERAMDLFNEWFVGKGLNYEEVLDDASKALFRELCFDERRFKTS